MVRCSRLTIMVSIFLLAGAGSCGEAKAGFINGGFETGDFTGWSTIGSASIQTDAFGAGPPQGNYQAFLSNGTGAVSSANLESFLGLSAGSLDALGNGTTTTGSGLSQSITANAGDVVTFQWDFLTNEDTPSTNNDFSFVSIKSLQTLADTNYPNFISSNTSFLSETGFQTFSYTIPTAGTYKVGVGVVNVGDTSVESGLLVDNFVLTASAVPEPGSLVLGGLGALGVLTIYNRRRRSRSASQAGQPESLPEPRVPGGGGKLSVSRRATATRR